MDIPGVVCVQPEEEERLERLAQMMGRAFLDEPWTREIMTRMKLKPAEALEASVQIMRTNMFEGAPFKRVYCLEDESACLIAYRKSELGEYDNNHFEELALKSLLKLPLATPLRMLKAMDVMKKMEPISDFGWYPQYTDGDFIHLVDLGVDASQRGEGHAAELMRAFFAYADEAGLPCFLETFSDELESIYEHLGMRTVMRKTSPGVELSERCMMRETQA